MSNIFSKTLASIFGGSKSERDVKTLSPRIKDILTAYDSYSNLSNDEIRNKSLELRESIQAHLSKFNNLIVDLKNQVEQNPEMESYDKEKIFNQIDAAEKDRNKELEVYLLKILPQGFALMKETARRFTQNSEIEATATDRDRELAASKVDFLRIEGDKVIYLNHWSANGTPITWDMIHYDVQLIGGMVLHEGKIAEMATGEGKTLVSTLPAYLNAISGFGVHIVTVNDYLAKRDCLWNKPIYEFLNVKVDCIEFHEPNSTGRKNAYAADITYGTNNEFGFDYLRDNMASSPDEIVQRSHHFAMVDEVDSVLIDDARTPLIISGPTPRGDQHEFHEMKPRVERLVKAQREEVLRMLTRLKDLFKSGISNLSKEQEKEAGLLIMRCYRGLPKNGAFIKFLSEQGNRAFLLKWEAHYLQEQQKNMPEVDKELYFVIEEKNKQVDLSDKGINLITSQGEDPEFFIMPDVGTKMADLEKSGLDPQERLKKKDELMTDFTQKSERIHTVQQLLKAYTMFDKDVEYIVADNKVMIVDEQTGRVLDGRRYSDGLHQAIESKENVTVEAATQTYATVTLQNFFRMYHKLCGMTGTAETEAGELWSIYKLDVVSIPTNRPAVRKDEEDLVYKTKKEKFNAVIEEIQKLTAAGRPVLVGTTSVEISELLSKMLSLRKIQHNVLNAKQHEREAEIVANAGLSSAVTIATNMAGRGTDIKLGAGVKDAGGLAIVGTERHESRRVDRQLRGRAGRQGDPGSSQFYVCLEDDLMRLFGSDRIAKTMDRFGHKEGDVIQHGLITSSIENAQKKVEQNNFGIRKRLLEYDDVMNNQREVIYKKRRNALFGDRLEVDIKNMIEDYTESLITPLHQSGDFDSLEFELLKTLSMEVPFDEPTFSSNKLVDVNRTLFNHLYNQYKEKNQRIADSSFEVIEQIHKNEDSSKIENLMVPFTDGSHIFQIAVPFKDALATKGMEVVKTYEKSVTLNMIDDEWKEHLRVLDDLRQSVGNAYLEQKDPLVIYKMESFKLFNELLEKVNRDVLSSLFKGRIYTEEEENAPSRSINSSQKARRQENKAPKLTQSRDDIFKKGAEPEYLEYEEGNVFNNQAQNERNEASQQVREKIEPRKVGPKVGRNDNCPCGSGKKFKNCHGA